jgi:hypothetical protein
VTNQIQNEWKIVNDKFDELAKGLAQSVTRRGALKKFGIGLAGSALAALGQASRAEADSCRQSRGCGRNHFRSCVGPNQEHPHTAFPRRIRE